MKKAVTKVKQGHREGCRSQRSNGKACQRSGEQWQGLSEVRRATVKPARGQANDRKACRIQIEAKYDSARPLQGLSKAKERRRGLSEVKRATVKPVEGPMIDNEAYLTQIKTISDSARSVEGHRTTKRPIGGPVIDGKAS